MFSKYRFTYQLILLLVVGFAITFTSCKDEEEKKTKIFGSITVDNVDLWNTWQDSGVVELTIFPEFSLDPLSGWGEIPDDFFAAGSLGGTYAVGAPYNSQNPIIFNFEEGKTTFDYEIEVEAGTYSSLALGFRKDNVQDPTKKTATLGVHFDNPADISHGIVLRIQAGPTVMTIFDYPAPISITLEEGEEKEINFKADFDFVNSWYQ
ncbi:MAG: hypothetical protein V3V14_09925 [Saprospiraceae bacterium]